MKSSKLRDLVKRLVPRLEVKKMKKTMTVYICTAGGLDVTAFKSEEEASAWCKENEEQDAAKAAENNSIALPKTEYSWHKHEEEYEVYENEDPVSAESEAFKVFKSFMK